MPEAFTVVDDDDVPISGYRWRTAGSVTGAVHIAHGLGEHALRYDRLARALSDAGYSVTAHDQRGHGRTAEATGGLGHLGPRGMEGTLDSLHAATASVRDLEPDVPFFLLGHSWGSMLAQRFALRWENDLTGLVLSGTTLMEPLFLPPTDLNAPFQPAVTDYDWLSRDADEVARYVEDPLCGFQPDFPFQEMANLLGGPTDAVPAGLPVLILNGSVDPVGGEAGGAALAAAYRSVGVRDVTFRSYPHARHEVFNETNRDDVVADLIAWLEARGVTTMRVITQGAFGGPGVLHEAGRPIPAPGPTEIRVHVRAAGVNPVDWKTRAGGGMAGVLGELPFVLGWDVAGMVDAVGMGVTRFEVGDWVFGMPWFPREAGAYAEFAVAPSRQFARSPRSIDDIHAGGLPLSGLTAWQTLVDTADVQAGQRVLIHAAAGGVGHLAVQIAKARGAYVIGTASAAKHDLLGDLGVDEAVDYRSHPFDEVVHDVDVAVDLVGGDDAFRALRTVRRGGVLVSVPSGVPPDLIDAAAEAGVRATGILVEPDYASLERIAELVDGGELRVHVAETFRLADAGRAHEVGEAGRTAGKLVLTT